MSRKLGSDLATHTLFYYHFSFEVEYIFIFEIQSEKGSMFTECLLCANTLLPLMTSWSH